jgi:putative ABC transport system substrate-binding protein
MHFDRLKRRQFITLLGSAAVTWPLAARAQQPAMPVIGLLDAGFAADRIHVVAAFRQGLAEAGYVEGRNVEFEFRWADDQLDRLPALARDLIDRRVAIIAAFGNTAALAAKAATSSIPVVFSSSSDPVAIGLITNLIQPGGNITGVTILNQEFETTRLERLIQVTPQATTIAFLVNPDSLTTTAKMREMDGAARAFGRQLHLLEARSGREFEGVFTSMEQQRIGAMVVASDTVFSNASGELGHVSTRHAIPVVGAYRRFVEAGGLMSYGTALADSYRRLGGCAGRILKGEPPGGLPVQQSTKVEFVINLRTANKLGLQIPASLRAITDEVIE